MNRLLQASAGLALLTATAVPITRASVAHTAIQHCRSAHGVAVYTDRSCAALGARAVPMSSELIQRIAASGDNSAYAISTGDYAKAALSVAARRSPASGCARSAPQLARDLEGAFALGDVNRIAESYHWVGLSHRQGQHIMQRLQHLSDTPLLQAHYFDAYIRSGWVQVADSRTGIADSGGMMQLVFGEDGGGRALDLQVQRYHGCYFVRF